MKNVIYLWENEINGKVYVGQAKDFEARTKQHIEASKGHSLNNFHFMLRKYGVSNFEVYPLEVDVEPSKLDMREAHWIKIFNSYYSGGYNSTPGNYGARKQWEEECKIRSQLFDFQKKNSKISLPPIPEYFQTRSENRKLADNLIYSTFIEKKTFKFKDYSGPQKCDNMLRCTLSIQEEPDEKEKKLY